MFAQFCIKIMSRRVCDFGPVLCGIALFSRADALLRISVNFFGKIFSEGRKMYKIAFFDTKPYDKEWFDKYAGDDLDITYF